MEQDQAISRAPGRRRPALRKRAEEALALLADASGALAVVELGTLTLGAHVTASFAALVLFTFAAFAACALFVAPFAAVAAFLRPRRRSFRIASGILTAALVVAAFAIDASFYVRTYPKYHVALGLAASAGAVYFRAALGVEIRRVRERLLVVGIGVVMGTLALCGRYDIRSYVRMRSVIPADVLEVLLPSVGELPPIPRAAQAPSVALAPLGNKPTLILLITVDALRFDMVEAAVGDTFATLRDASVHFPTARTVAPSTISSLYGLMTGKGPWHVQFARTVLELKDPAAPSRVTDEDPRSVWLLPLHDRSPTLAERLHGVGYRTSVCTSIPFQTKDGGLIRDFDDVDETVYLEHNLFLTGTTSDRLTACGLAMIERASGAPQLLWLHYPDPHAPYLIHRETPPRGDSARDRYDGEVAFVGLHLAGLLANVKQRVGLDRTLVVLTADHGEEFGEHGGKHHSATLMEEILRVPLLFGSAMLPARRVDQDVSILDVAPTILELVGAAPLQDADGRSLVPLLRGGSLAERPVFAELQRADRPQRAVVDGGFKLVYAARSRGFMLYDLTHDPTEREFVTDAHLDIVKKLAREIGAPEPTPFFPFR